MCVKHGSLVMIQCHHRQCVRKHSLGRISAQVQPLNQKANSVQYLMLATLVLSQFYQKYFFVYLQVQVSSIVYNSWQLLWKINAAMV